MTQKKLINLKGMRKEDRENLIWILAMMAEKTIILKKAAVTFRGKLPLLINLEYIYDERKSD